MSAVIITQSNYIPWKGYFSSMRKAKYFVVYDEMQYTKRDWRNRNILITEKGPRWITIPIEVKGKYYQKISEAQVSNLHWGTDHWNFIKNNYGRAKYFKEYKSVFEELYLNPISKYLSEINVAFINKILLLLNIKIEIISSSEFNLVGNRTEKLVNICKELGASKYLTGPSAKNYMDENIFEKEQIKVEYYDFSGYPEYKQQWDKFDHSVSILDMFFNLGPNTIKYFN